MLELCIVNNHDIAGLCNSKIFPHIENVVCLSSQITSVVQVKPVGLLIDFPYGQANAQIREHEILYGIRNNVNFIDVTINTKLIKDRDFKAILLELRTIKQIIGTSKAKLRPIIECVDCEIDVLIDLCTSIYNNGLASYIVVGTGVYNTDVDDIIIYSALIQEKSNLRVIGTVQNLTEKYLELFNKSKIHGVRVMSQKSLERIFK